MEEYTFHSYTKGVPIFFKYTKPKGIQWHRDIVPAIQKALFENNIKVRQTAILIEGIWWDGFVWEKVNFPKYVFNVEQKIFIRQP